MTRSNIQHKECVPVSEVVRYIMSILGTIAEVWRYPVKSMIGERLESCPAGPRGVAGDRGWAVRDEQAGEIRGAKHLPKLLMCASRYLDEPQDGEIPHVEITLPNGSKHRTDRIDDANGQLSPFLGCPVTLWPLKPASDDAHYRRSRPMDSEQALREFLSREPDEALPELSAMEQSFLPEITEFATPRGTYFDVAPYHLLTTASIHALSAMLPEARLDVCRFRPNLLIETPPNVEGFVEFDWTGLTLRVGEMHIIGGGPVPRCGMTTAAQPGLPKDPSVLRTIVREVQQSFGIYGTTDHSGIIQVGDAVEHAQPGTSQ